MRKSLQTGLVVLAAVSTMSIGPAVAYDGSSSSRDSDYHDEDDLRVVGLASGGKRLVSFESDKPGSMRGAVTVRGLSMDTRLVGIDYRVQDGALYGVGEKGGVYMIDARTGKATLVVRLTVALSGSSFGVDFNPAANALRIVSDTGQNLRQSFVPPVAPAPGPFAGTVTDTPLSYPPTPPATATTALGITGAAYTNNDTDANTATTLFDLDTAMDQIAIQAPANSGLLSPTGKLGVDATGDTGFDIYSTVRAGSTVDLTAFAVINGKLYEVDLLTGKAKSLGGLGASVTDIAIPLGQL